MLKYEFDIEFDVPVAYPTTAPEIAIPELGTFYYSYNFGYFILLKYECFIF